MSPYLGGIGRQYCGALVVCMRITVKGPAEDIASLTAWRTLLGAVSAEAGKTAGLLGTAAGFLGLWKRTGSISAAVIASLFVLLALTDGLIKILEALLSEIRERSRPGSRWYLYGRSLQALTFMVIAAPALFWMRELVSLIAKLGSAACH